MSPIGDFNILEIEKPVKRFLALDMKGAGKRIAASRKSEDWAGRMADARSAS